MANKTYDANSISVLEGLEAVRKRPGMYIGSVSTKGLNHLIYEIVDNSVDEFLAGYCDEITVSLNKDGTATITDNGRGIPVGINERTGKTAGPLHQSVGAGLPPQLPAHQGVCGQPAQAPGGGSLYGHRHGPCAGGHPHPSGTPHPLRGDHQLRPTQPLF